MYKVLKESFSILIVYPYMYELQIERSVNLKNDSHCYNIPNSEFLRTYGDDVETFHLLTP